MTGAGEHLKKTLGYSFKDPDLLDNALTHSSTGRDKNYERLEFLGDRVLGLIVSEMLFERFPDEAEGDLAKRLAALVTGPFLARMAREIELGAYIGFSVAEAQAGGSENDNILADVFEALIGALYLDGGLEPCRTMIGTYWEDEFFKMKAPPQHPKTEIQEWAQARSLPLPAYEIIKQDGPDHAPVFAVRMTVKGRSPVTAEGRTRQEAEKNAALAFLAALEEHGKR